MKRNERIQWFHKKITDKAYPNAHRLADNFDISISQAKRDVAFLREELDAPLQYDTEKRGYFYEAPFSLPVYLTHSNDEDVIGVLAAIEADIDESSIMPVVQMQLPYNAVISVSDKLAILELRPFIIGKSTKDTYICEFHSVEVFLSAILSLEADIKLLEPEWLRNRLVNSAKRIIKNNETL